MTSIRPDGNSSLSGRITIVYANIGRGHPFYLDGLLEAFVRRGQIGAVKGQADVFELSTGLGRWGWRAARWLYKRGSSGGLIGHVYRRIRTGADYNRPSFMLRVMGKDIRARFMATAEPVIVSHPILVAILSGKAGLVYQHGEVVTPREAVVTGAETVLVPTSEAAEPFVEGGYESRQVFVSGLCIEPQLARQAADCFAARLNRINSRSELSGGFFSSGAEPREHAEKLVAAAVSAVNSGGRAIIFATRSGRLARRAEAAFRRRGIALQVVGAADKIPHEFGCALLVCHTTRREENLLTAQLFSRLDYFLAPSHERTNWALGLGLPMFVATPAIGPFAPLNLKKLLDSGVAEQVTSTVAEQFGTRLHELRTSGGLDAMAQSGYGRYEITGFERIVDFLINKYGETP